MKHDAQGRRSASRKQVSLPVEIGSARGWTTDITPQRVCFTTDIKLSAGDPIRFAVVLEGDSPTEVVRMQCDGRVLRAGAAGGEYLVAATIDSFWFERSGEDLRTSSSLITPEPEQPAISTPEEPTVPYPKSRARRSHRVLVVILCLAAALIAPGLRASCESPANAIEAENCLTGNPSSEWEVSGAGDSSIQGFATDISVDQGETITFKIDTPSTDYRLDIYRLGYYGGLGARQVDSIQPSVTLPQTQPACLTDAATGLIDCGNWTKSASWDVPANATSGIYIAKLVREDVAGASHVPFVVRDDDGNSDILFQTADTTWQAYNSYGGNSLYTGSPAGRAYKVSYNRPFNTRGTAIEDWLFNAEYPMVRWLERNGYDVSYFTGVDSDRFGTELLEHQLFLSVGHDEYWSGAQRSNVEAARAAGVHLGFFSSNEIFWKTRWEASIDGSGTSHRTLVCYKETHAGAKIDPLPGVWTGTWRDPRPFNPEGPQPENALSGTIFTVNSGTTEIEVPAAYGAHRFWRNTAAATLSSGQKLTLPDSTVGYEWDEDLDNGFRPPGLVRLSLRTINVPERILDHGSTYGAGVATHSATLYRHASGALVFGAGTLQWSWGLDDEHDRGNAAPSADMQQATVNLFADMGAQPATLQAGLVAASASTDVTAPGAPAIVAPANGSTVQLGTTVAISGTATDTGGIPAGVEISFDDGLTWRRAEGRASWSYDWVPSALGSATFKVRATDDSGNIGAWSATTSVTVEPRTCPCTIWPSSATPAVPNETDSQPIEVGVKFRSSEAGYITALRFYKGTSNTGTHVGHLWTSAGTLLSAVTFTGESASGWQEMALPAPVAIAADTTYVASYHSASGYYGYDVGYFTSAVGDPPLSALADGFDGPNGVYKYGASGFPTTTFNASNYWVDVVFNQTAPADTTPPAVSTVTPANGASAVAVQSNVTVAFNEPMNAATLDAARFELRDSANALVPASVSYNAGTLTATLDPASPLAYSTTFTAKVKGGLGGAADVAGNELAADFTWTFTTAGEPPPPPDEGPGGPVLVVSSTSNKFARYYAEILRTEGLNYFNVTDISTVDAPTLANYDVVILGDIALSGAQVTMFTDWVTAGGNLIAMRPDKQLASLLGLTDASATLAEGYLQVNTAAAPGQGIEGQTIQFHGTADRYALNGATAIAMLYSDAATATTAPAVTILDVGSNGGQAAAFTFDLARSVVYTRQGNPAWSGDERDGQAGPIRSNDLFYGAKAGDGQPDWVDLNKVQIPQADEQQRLLANLILQMNSDRKPLPRFWYLPRGEKAAVVMTGDDHGSGGTTGQFEAFKTASAGGCSVSNWDCVRATSYIYPGTSVPNASLYQSEGFEIALHVDTGCSNWTAATLPGMYTTQLASFASAFPALAAPVTHRTHCIAWSDWATQPQVELANGIRFDTNYYYWPGSWVQDRPGMFTGSGMPMRFADLDGTMIDVYQAATQMPDESDMTYATHIATLLDNAIGAPGYYGVFTMNMHTDSSSHAGADTVVAAAQARSVPVVSAKQMLEWLDGRNGSSFGSLSFASGTLSFTIAQGSGANGLQALLPVQSISGQLTAITRGGSPVSYSTETMKGVEYARFTALAGSYEASYLTDSTPPVISVVSATPAVGGTATITWTTDEPSTSSVTYSNGSPQTVSDPAMVTSHTISLSGLTPGTLYTYDVSSTDASSNTGSSNGHSFTSSPAAFIDTTFADFSGGTPGSTYVTQTANGEVTLAPAAGAEFNGTSLPAGWIASPWSGGGAGTVSGGTLAVDEALVATTSFFAAGRTLEFVATFTTNNQHAGFANDFNTGDWAIFSTSGGGSLFARVNGSGGTNVDLGASYLNAPHLYRIVWNANSVVFFIDGVQVNSQAATLSGNLRPAFSESTGAGALVVDWARMTPYSASGTFDSRIFDGGGPTAWGALDWTSVVPAGTSLALEVRSGNTPAPDASWSAFSPVASPGGDVPGTSRYLQYRASFGASDTQFTPELQEVAIAYAASSDTTPPTIVTRAPEPSATGVARDANISIEFSEAMNPATITAATVRLRADGAGSDVPAALSYSGLTATLDPSEDLAPGTSYTATVAGSVTDAAGNALGSDSTWSFTTQATGGFVDTTLADFSAGSPGTATAVAQRADGEVILLPTLHEEFSGATLPGSWESSNWTAGGSASVSGGVLTAQGIFAAPTTSYAAGRAIEFVATFGAATFQHVGFGQLLAEGSESWAMFGTHNTGTGVYARTNVSGTAVDTPIAGSFLGSPHHYRIVWNASSVEFYIDGALVHTQAAAITQTMRPVVSDYDSSGPAVAVDWIRMSPYPATGTFESRIFDGGAPRTWTDLSWIAQTPAGTTLAMAVRTGNTALPDSSWTDFIPVATSGAAIGWGSRYIQYRAALETADGLATPSLEQVTIGFSASADTTGPSVVTRSPGADATNIPQIANVVVTFSEPLDPASVNTATLRLRAAGAVSDVPATVSYSGLIATLDPVSDLQAGKTYSVTVASSVSDTSGNVLGADVTWTFTTEAIAAQFTDTTVSDFSAGTLDANGAIAEIADGEVILKAVVNEEFGGSALPAGWDPPEIWSAGGSATVTGGSLVVDGARANTTALYSAGRSLEFVATFGATSFQHVGFGVDVNTSAYWAMFSTGNTSDTLRARTNNAGSVTDVVIPGTWLGSPQRFRIDWTSTAVIFSINGTVVHTENVAITQPMRPLASEFNSGGPVLSVDWLRMSDYSTPSAFLSRVFDAGANASWGALSWNAATPDGASVSMSYRTGNTLVPDASWTSFSAVASSGGSMSGASRYVQYRADLATSIPSNSPVLENVTIAYVLAGLTGTTTEVTSSDNPSTLNQPITLTATVSPLSATGSVSFKAGSEVIGTGSLSEGVAALTTDALGVGTHSITAVYTGDSSYDGSTSSALDQEVNAPAHAVASLSPSSRCAGSDSFELTVTGAAFVSGATVLWNGSARTTTFISAGELRASIDATDLASVGTATVRVRDLWGNVSATLQDFAISADAEPPVVTPPGPIVVRQAQCSAGVGVASGATVPALQAFLAAGSALDGCSTVTPLPPKVGESIADDDTLFAGGLTAVTFRFSDNSDNEGSADSSVRVELYGDLDYDGIVDSIDGVIYSNFVVGNISAGTAPFLAPEALGDLNNDEMIDSLDLVILANYMVRNLTCLPQ